VARSHSLTDIFFGTVSDTDRLVMGKWMYVCISTYM
jgi:hypothetical protein